MAELGEGQVGSELPAAVPDRAAGLGGVGGEGDGEAGDLAGVAGAEPLADADAGGVEAGEELVLAGGGGGRGADGPAEGDAGWLVPVAAAGLL